MTAILGLTTTDKVRATWGLTQSELPDTMLDALDLADLLTLELADLDLDYEAIQTAGEAASPSASERKLWYCLKAFATNFCAWKVTSSVRLAAPQKMGDGNNTFSRFQGAALEETCKEVAAGYLAALQALRSAADLSVVSPATLVAAAEPAFDPVIGE